MEIDYGIVEYIIFSELSEVLGSDASACQLYEFLNPGSFKICIRFDRFGLRKPGIIKFHNNSTIPNRIVPRYQERETRAKASDG